MGGRRAARRRREDRPGRAHLRNGPGAGPLARAPRVLCRRGSFLRRRPLCRLGRAHRPAAGRAGTPWSSRSVPSSTAFRPRPSSIRATARRPPSEPSFRETRSSPSCAREVRGPARHARHPPARAAGLVAREAGVRAPVRAVRLPPDRHAGVRGHRALRPHVGPGVGHRLEGDVHVRRPRRPLADAARGGDGADRPRVPRARPTPRAAAAEALHVRDDLPLRPTAEGPLSRALAARRRVDRL